MIIHRVAPFAFVLVASLFVAGCGGSGSSLPADELSRAETAVSAALAAWKNGESSAQWHKRAPEFTFVDPDWRAGVRLTDFEIRRTEGRPGENARIWTTLTLAGPRRKSEVREVVYEANLEKRAIARDAFN